METDLFGGTPAPPARHRRIVQHQPAETPLVLFETIGSAEREGFPAEAPGAETAGQAQNRTHRAGPERSRTKQAPHVRGSATSRAAAVAITPKLGGKRLVVLREICATESLRQGFTDNELIQHMVRVHGWNGNTPRARRIELVGDGWVASTETTRNKSTVWTPTDAAMAWYLAGMKE